VHARRFIDRRRQRPTMQGAMIEVTSLPGRDRCHDVERSAMTECRSQRLIALVSSRAPLTADQAGTGAMALNYTGAF